MINGVVSVGARFGGREEEDSEEADESLGRKRGRPPFEVDMKTGLRSNLFDPGWSTAAHAVCTDLSVLLED